MFATPEPVPLALPWARVSFADLPWGSLPRLSGDLLAVMFVTAVTMLLNTAGIEFVTRREADLERELTTLGTANLLSSALGGCSTACRSRGPRSTMPRADVAAVFAA